MEIVVVVVVVVVVVMIVVYVIVVVLISMVVVFVIIIIMSWMREGWTANLHLRGTSRVGPLSTTAKNIHSFLLA